MSSPNSKIAATKIPNITELRQKLDYGDPRLARCSAFYDDVRVFRKKFHTSNGLPGIDLYDWKSREHQAGLTEMTHAYLEKEGNGSVYWPDDDTSPNRNSLRYSMDHVRIKRLVKQLFFRLNQQQYRNNKYKHKGKPESTGRDDGGKSTEDPIDLDAIETISKIPSEAALSPPSSNYPSNAKTVSPRANIVDEALRGPVCGSKVHGTSSKDVYEVSVSPEPLHSTNSRSFTVSNKAPNTKHSRRSEDATAQARHAKRLKLQPTPTTKGDVGVVSRSRSPLVASKRTSTRGRKEIPRPEYATEEQLNEATASPAPEKTSGTDLDHIGNRSSRTSPEDIASNFGDTQHTTAEEIGGNISESDSPPSQEPEHFIATGTTQSYDPNENTQSIDTSRLAFVPLPTPSSISEGLKASRQSSEQWSPPKQKLPSKPSINFMYRVVLSRTPIYLCEGWNPKGKFQEKSLHDLIEELPLKGDIKGLVFTLEGPGMKYKQQIYHGDEDQFEAMKRHFNRLIRACLANRGNSNSHLLLEIEIEPLRSETTTGNEEIDDGDLDW